MLEINNFLKKAGFLIMLYSAAFTFADTVEYPSLVQPGTANLTTTVNQWTFSNNLFSASYILNGGKLYFNGSSELSLGGGTEIFQITLGNGAKIRASQMNWSEIKTIDLPGNSIAQRLSERQNGKALTATLTYQNLTIKWKAVLRDGSHYLRTEMEIFSSANTSLLSITPMTYKVLNQGKQAPVVVGNTRGAVVASDYLFAGLETPLAFNTTSSIYNPNFNPKSWTINSWVSVPDSVPSPILNLGFSEAQVVVSQGDVQFSSAGNWAIRFQYSSGSHRMNLTGVDIVKNGTVVASDYHIGYTGNAAANNTYSINVPASGTYTLRYFGETKTETITSSGTISFTCNNTTYNDGITSIPHTSVDSLTIITGKWSRNTTLQTTDTFRVSSVIGLLANGQRRRSFLAYHERERAVPWRSFVLYNSWYELGITCNNNTDPLQRMTETKCYPIVNAWKTKLSDPYKIGIDAFVWDDGWDNFNSLWNFHIGFPRGFTKLDSLAKIQGSGTGAWLGPVGGYGSAKQDRLNYWNSTHTPAISNFQLSNKEYFDAFVGRCSQMVHDYDHRFFKFDGISTFYSATGPDNEEDAEGIINVLNTLRQKRADLFFNTTVGSWASPFWFHFTDAVWRQENDFGQIGNQGNAREQWITYRDRLVYQNFVTNSPLCPINSLMTHGLIVTKNGPPNVMARNNTTATRDEIIREMRCAFACGSGMVELYVDNDLMSGIGNNALWGELANCINWHRNNKDVLADIHWVGGNPWDGSNVNVYGWAAWNKTKSVLTLRNPSASAKTYTTTLRQALDIPAYITGKIHLTDAFSGQAQFIGITNSDVDIDTSVSFNLPASSVVVLNGSPITTGLKDLKDNTTSGSIIFGNKTQIEFRKVESGSTIQISDITGKLLYKNVKESTDFSIPVPNIGVYVVVITDKNNKVKQTQKVHCN